MNATPPTPQVSTLRGTTVSSGPNAYDSSTQLGPITVVPSKVTGVQTYEVAVGVVIAVLLAAVLLVTALRVWQQRVRWNAAHDASFVLLENSEDVNYRWNDAEVGAEERRGTGGGASEPARRSL
ncbi:uncharacterized protein LOC142929647 isoform X2 [Petromyzon marinus]|uniref:uncharacterized protein LOC142929647 isoform X2 n=1 Tax=Petromyzon marinus TaxID=7757 RepID=UPI003F6F141B